MTQFLSVMNDWIERIPLYPANIERKDAIMISCRFEAIEIGRVHGKAKNQTENPASKRTKPTGSHMALFLSTGAANLGKRHQSQSTMEIRFQRKHDDEIGEYLNSSRRRRHARSFIRTIKSALCPLNHYRPRRKRPQALRGSHCTRLKPERRSWCARWRQACPPCKSRQYWIWSTCVFICIQSYV